MVFRRFARVIGLTVAVLSMPVALVAQSGSSTFIGVVKDASGAAVPGAQVRVVNEETSVSVESVTNLEHGSVPLNRANLNIPGFTLGAADFGVITSARPARTVQVGARLSF